MLVLLRVPRIINRWYRRGQFSETCVSQFSDFAPDLDDVGHELRAEFTPVRSDGVRGAPVSREFVVFSGLCIVAFFFL